jgi:hypothetical protein
LQLLAGAFITGFQNQNDDSYGPPQGFCFDSLYVTMPPSCSQWGTREGYLVARAHLVPLSCCVQVLRSSYAG